MTMIYAFRKNDNSTIHIHDSENGRACGCVCLECNQPVIAKQGDIYQNHFAHVSNLENENACTFNLVKSCARKLIQEISSQRKLFTPSRETKGNKLISQENGKLLELTQVNTLPTIDDSYYSVECLSIQYSPFEVRFITNSSNFEASHNSAGERFLIIDVFSFVKSFDNTFTIKNDTILSLLYQDSPFKRASDKSSSKLSVGLRCCFQPKNQITDYCLSCGKKLKK